MTTRNLTLAVAVLATCICTASSAGSDSVSDEWRRAIKRATTAYLEGDHARAEALSNEAISRLRSGSPCVEAEVRLLTIRGDAQSEQEHFGEARDSYEEALRIAAESLAVDHGLKVSTLTALAILETSAGNPAAAERRALEAMKIVSSWEKSRAQSDASTIGIGVVLRDLGRYREAKQVFEVALVAQRAKYGPSHINTAVATAGVAYVDFELGRYEAAYGNLMNALAVLEIALGKDHSFALHGRARLALVASRLGRHEEAIRLIRSALEAASSGAKVEIADRARLETTAAEVLFPARRLDEARLMADRALATWRRSKSDRDSDQTRALLVSGLLHFQQGERDLARREFEVTWKRRVELQGPSHPDTSRAAVLLGMVEVLDGHHKKGIERIESAVSHLQARLGEGHPDVRESKAVLLASREQAGAKSSNDQSD